MLHRGAGSGVGAVPRDCGLISFPSPPHPTPPQAFPLLFAVGQLDGSGTPQQHDEYSAATVNLASGATTAQATGSAEVQALRNAHAWLMVRGAAGSPVAPVQHRTPSSALARPPPSQAISFGFIFPCGVLVARGFKELGHTWFQIHRAVQARRRQGCAAGTLSHAPDSDDSGGGDTVL